MLVCSGDRKIEVDIARRAELVDAGDGRIAEVDPWIVDCIAAPNPDLGRPGDVCPFVAAALRLDSLWYAMAHGEDLTAMEMSSVVSSVLVEVETRRAEAERPNFVTCVVMFPDMSVACLAKRVLEVHRATKDGFVRRGSMLGEFLPGYDAPGVHNPSFRPLRSPVPLLVVRSMVASDAIFLTDNDEWLDLHAARYPRPDR